MKYNITITNDNTPQAKSILLLLRSLATDYDFLQIEPENENTLSEDLKKELDFRYEHFLNHADEYNIMKKRYKKNK